MLDHTKAIFQILKAIDVAFEKQNFDLKETFNLGKLNISEHRLILILENLVNYGYIDGIKISYSLNNQPLISISYPRLTLSGMDFLENNLSMKKAYRLLKELKEWIPGY